MDGDGRVIDVRVNDDTVRARMCEWVKCKKESIYAATVLSRSESPASRTVMTLRERERESQSRSAFRAFDCCDDGQDCDAHPTRKSFPAAVPRATLLPW